MSNEIPKFKLARKTLPVEVEDAEGNTQTYTLQELSGKERDMFMKKISDKARLDDTGKAVGFKDQVGVISFLLSMSLLDEKGKAISEKTIDGWPTEITDALGKMSVGLSGISETEAVKAGNV